MGLISRVPSRTYRLMFRLTAEVLRAPGKNIHKGLNIQWKKRHTKQVRNGQARLKRDLKRSDKIIHPQHKEEPYSAKHLTWYPKTVQKKLYMDSQKAQWRAGLPNLIGKRFPRFLNVVDPVQCSPILQIKKTTLKHCASIAITTSPWQSGSDVAFEFWRHITSLEVRTTNVKCDIKCDVLNTKAPDTITIKFIDGETLIFETNHLKFDEVWYHFNPVICSETKPQRKKPLDKCFKNKNYL